MQPLRHTILLLTLLLAWNHSVQQVVTSRQFDQIYNEVLADLYKDSAAARATMETLLSSNENFSPVHKAQIGFLKFLLLRADKTKFFTLENRLFTAPDSLKGIDSILYVSCRYLERSMPDKAIPLLLQAIGMAPQNSAETAACIINLGEAYRQKQEYAKGISNLNELLSGKTPLSEDDRAYAYNRLAALYNEYNHPKPGCVDSVFKYSNLCMAISEKTGNKRNLAMSQNELSYQYLRIKNYQKALDLSNRAVQNFKDAGMPFHAMNTLINQSNIYIGERRYGHALQAMEEAMEMSEIEQNRNLYMRLFFQLARIYQIEEEYKEALELLRISYYLQSVFFKDRINMQINEQSARYDLLVKEQKIREEKEKNEYRKKQITFLIVIAVSLLISLIASLLYYWLRKKVIMRQKLLEAVAETEAQERKRIARDLHDGLGPVLSAINHYFQAFLDSGPEDKEAIRSKLQQVIADAIEEVSRISQNISPHVLENHGLVTALKNFMAPLAKNNNIQIHFQSNLTKRFDKKKELTVYRCITELFTNTLKHAGATVVSLNITGNEKTLQVMYSDNGMGFIAGKKQSGGMGLHNIRYRIESFGGTLFIESSPHKGMNARIEIPI